MPVVPTINQQLQTNNPFIKGIYHEYDRIK